MDILSDLRYSLRELRKRPTFTATAILSLSLGIGATTAVFSVIYAVLINPYPYRDANRLTIIRLVEPQGTERETGYTGPQIAQFRRLKSFESVIALQNHAGGVSLESLYIDEGFTSLAEQLVFMISLSVFRALGSGMSRPAPGSQDSFTG